MICIVKSQAFLRTPMVTVIIEGEDWMVGFDEVFEEISDHSVLEFDGVGRYPASRIETNSGSGYRIELDLEGFAKANPHVNIEDGFVVVRGNKTEYAERQNENYLQRGISARGFRRSFQLGQGARVIGTDLNQGILQIDIEQEIPSRMEPVIPWVRTG